MAEEKLVVRISADDADYRASMARLEQSIESIKSKEKELLKQQKALGESTDNLSAASKRARDNAIKESQASARHLAEMRRLVKVMDDYEKQMASLRSSLSQYAKQQRDLDTSFRSGGTSAQTYLNTQRQIAAQQKAVQAAMKTTRDTLDAAKDAYVQLDAAATKAARAKASSAAAERAKADAKAAAEYNDAVQKNMTSVIQTEINRRLAAEQALHAKVKEMNDRGVKMAQDAANQRLSAAEQAAAKKIAIEQATAKKLTEFLLWQVKEEQRIRAQGSTQSGMTPRLAAEMATAKKITDFLMYQVKEEQALRDKSVAQAQAAASRKASIEQATAKKITEYLNWQVREEQALREKSAKSHANLMARILEMNERAVAQAKDAEARRVQAAQEAASRKLAIEQATAKKLTEFLLWQVKEEQRARKQAADQALAIERNMSQVIEQERRRRAASAEKAASAEQARIKRMTEYLMYQVNAELALRNRQEAAARAASQRSARQMEELKRRQQAERAAHLESMRRNADVIGMLNDLSMKMFVVTFASAQMFEFFIKGFVGIGEELVLFKSRLEMLTGTADSFQPILDMSSELGIRIGDVTETFTRFAIANTVMKRTQEDLVAMTETVVTLGMVSGGTTQEISNGLRQLGQGLASNRLSGDELRSVLENIPLVAVKMAEKLGVGVGTLREMGTEGKLTGDVVSQALIDIQEEAEVLQHLIPDTTDKAFNRVANAWQNIIYSLVDGTDGVALTVKAFNSLAETMDSFADYIDKNATKVLTILEGLGKALLALFVLKMGRVAVSAITLLSTALTGTMLPALVKTKMALIGLAATWSNAFAAGGSIALASMASVRLALTGIAKFIMGPWGLALAVAGASVWALTGAFKNQADEVENLSNMLKLNTQRVDELSVAQLAATKNSLSAAIRTQKREVRDIDADIREEEKRLNELLDGQNGLEERGVSRYALQYTRQSQAIAIVEKQLQSLKGLRDDELSDLRELEDSHAEVNGRIQDQLGGEMAKAEMVRSQQKQWDSMEKNHDKIAKKLVEHVKLYKEAEGVVNELGFLLKKNTITQEEHVELLKQHLTSIFDIEGATGKQIQAAKTAAGALYRTFSAESAKWNKELVESRTNYSILESALGSLESKSTAAFSKMVQGLRGYSAELESVLYFMGVDASQPFDALMVQSGFSGPFVQTLDTMRRSAEDLTEELSGMGSSGKAEQFLVNLATLMETAGFKADEVDAVVAQLQRQLDKLDAGGADAVTQAFIDMREAVREAHDELTEQSATDYGKTFIEQGSAVRDFYDKILEGARKRGFAPGTEGFDLDKWLSYIDGSQSGATAIVERYTNERTRMYEDETKTREQLAKRDLDNALKYADELEAAGKTDAAMEQRAIAEAEYAEAVKKSGDEAVKQYNSIEEALKGIRGEYNTLIESVRSLYELLLENYDDTFLSKLGTSAAELSMALLTVGDNLNAVVDISASREVNLFSGTPGGGYAKLTASAKEYVDAAADVLELNDRQKANLSALFPHIDTYAEKYGVAREALIALINTESRFNANADSGVAKGFGQFKYIPEAKSGISVVQELAAKMRDLGHEGANTSTIFTDLGAHVEAMTYHFTRHGAKTSTLEEKYRAYNAGVGNMNKGFKETLGHQQRSMDAFNKLQAATQGLTVETEGVAAAQESVVASATQANQVVGQSAQVIEKSTAATQDYISSLSGLDRQYAIWKTQEKAMESQIKQAINIQKELSNGTVLSSQKRKEYTAILEQATATVQQHIAAKQRMLEQEKMEIEQGERRNWLIERNAKEMHELAKSYDPVISAKATYNTTVVDTNELVAAGVMSQRAANKAVEESAIAYARAQGPMGDFYAGLRENTFDLERVAADALDGLMDNFTDALIDGEADFESFVDDILKQLARMAVNTIVVNFVGNILGVEGGATGGTGTMQGGLTGNSSTSVFSSGGMTSALGNFGKMFGGNSMGQSMANAGMNFANMFGTTTPSAANYSASFGASSLMGDSLGTSMLAGSTAPPSWASNLAGTSNFAMAGGGLVGGFASKLLFDFDSEAESIGHTIGSTAGTVAASALLAPILGPFAPLVGAFLGGSAGGFLGGLFGGEDKPRMKANLWNTGGTIEIGDTNDMSQEAVQALNDMVSQANSAIQSYAGALGKGATDALENVSHSFMKVPEGKLSERVAFHWADSILAAVRGAADQAVGDGEDLLADVYRNTAASMSDVIHSKGGLLSESDAKEIERQYKEMFVDSGIIALEKSGQEVGAAFRNVMADMMSVVDDQATLDAAFSEFTGVIGQFGSVMAEMTGVEVTDLEGAATVFADYWKEFDHLSTNLGESLQAMVVAMGHLDSVIDLTATSLEGLSTKEIADLAKDLAPLAQGTAQYYELFYSEAERNARLIEAAKTQIDNAFDDLGIEVPETTLAFRDIVEALDLTSDEGRGTYTALMQIAPAFALVSDEAQSASLEISSIASALKNSSESIQDGIRDLLEGVIYEGIDAGPAFAEMIEQYIVGTLLDSVASVMQTAVINPLMDTLAVNAVSGELAGEGGVIDKAALDGVVAKAIAMSEGLATAFSDPAVKAAFESIGVALNDIGASAGGNNGYDFAEASRQREIAARLKEQAKEAEDAAKEALDRAEAWQSKADELHIATLRALGDEEAAVAFERDKAREELRLLGDGLVEVQDGLWALQDAVAWQVKADELHIEQLKAMGLEQEALNFERAQELEALEALDPAFAAIKQHTYDLIDAANALKAPDIAGLYQSLFDRAPDPSGLQWHTSQGYQSQGQAEAAMLASASRDDLEATLDLVYQELFGRLADDAGADYWIQQIQSGVITSLAALENALMLGADSADLMAKELETQLSVEDILSAYQSTLGRTVDAAGLGYWLAQELTDPAELEAGILRGAQGNDLNYLIDAAYQDLFSRYADASGQSYWAEQWANGVYETWDGLLQAMIEQASGEDLERIATPYFEKERSLGIELMKAEGSEQAALNAEREITLEQIPEQLRGLQQQVWLAEDAAAIASEREALEKQLLEVQGDTAALRQLELETIDESNRALQEQIWALQDLQEEIDAFASAADSLMDTLSDDIDGLRFTVPDAGEVEDSLSRAMVALSDATNAESFDAAAAERAISLSEEYRGTLLAYHDDLMSGLEDEKSLYESNIDAMASARESLQDWVDQLDRTSDSLTASEKRMAGWEQYQTMLSMAQAGDIDALGKITGIADDYLDSVKATSATNIEYRREVARRRNEIEALAQDTTDPNIEALEAVEGEIANLNITTSNALAELHNSVLSLRELWAGESGRQTEAIVGAITGWDTDVDDLIREIAFTTELIEGGSLDEGSKAIALAALAETSANLTAGVDLYNAGEFSPAQIEALVKLLENQVELVSFGVDLYEEGVISAETYDLLMSAIDLDGDAVALTLELLAQGAITPEQYNDANFILAQVTDTRGLTLSLLAEGVITPEQYADANFILNNAIATSELSMNLLAQGVITSEQYADANFILNNAIATSELTLNLLAEGVITSEQYADANFILNNAIATSELSMNLLAQGVITSEQYADANFILNNAIATSELTLNLLAEGVITSEQYADANFILNNAIATSELSMNLLAEGVITSEQYADANFILNNAIAISELSMDLLAEGVITSEQYADANFILNNAIATSELTLNLLAEGAITPEEYAQANFITENNLATAELTLTLIENGTIGEVGSELVLSATGAISRTLEITAGNLKNGTTSWIQWSLINNTEAGLSRTLNMAVDSLSKGDLVSKEAFDLITGAVDTVATNLEFALSSESMTEAELDRYLVGHSAAAPLIHHLAFGLTTGAGLTTDEQKTIMDVLGAIEDGTIDGAAIDVNLDGTISSSEFVNAFAALGIASESTLGSVFKSLDGDGNGVLNDIDEALSGKTPKTTEQWLEAIHDALAPSKSHNSQMLQTLWYTKEHTNSLVTILSDMTGILNEGFNVSINYLSLIKGNTAGLFSLMGYQEGIRGGGFGLPGEVYWDDTNKDFHYSAWTMGASAYNNEVKAPEKDSMSADNWSAYNYLLGIEDRMPDIPWMAEGGIVTNPTLAMIGEAGAEAVVPLDQYQPKPNQSFDGMIQELKSVRRELQEIKQENYELRMEQRRQHNASQRELSELRQIEEKREVIGLPKTREDA